jgi:hypothetical protein
MTLYSLVLLFLGCSTSTTAPSTVDPAMDPNEARVVIEEAAEEPAAEEGEVADLEAEEPPAAPAEAEGEPEGAEAVDTAGGAD